MAVDIKERIEELTFELASTQDAARRAEIREELEKLEGPKEE